MAVRMKTKLEAIANVTVIVVALAVGYVVLGRYVEAYRTPRSVAAGDRLGKIPGRGEPLNHWGVTGLNGSVVPAHSRGAGREELLRQTWRVT